MTWLLTLLGGQREPPTVQTIEQPQNKCNHEKHDMNSKKTTSCDLLDCCLKCFRSHNTTPPWHTLKRQLRPFFFWFKNRVIFVLGCCYTILSTFYSCFWCHLSFLLSFLYYFNAFSFWEILILLVLLTSKENGSNSHSFHFHSSFYKRLHM